MSLGYDVYDSDRSFEQKGITGDIQRYSREEMHYPCYIIRSEDDNKVGMHQITVLKNMFNTMVAYESGSVDNSIYIYFKQGGTTIKLGKIIPKQVKAFLRLFENNYVDCFLAEGKELIGVYKYALSE